MIIKVGDMFRYSNGEGSYGVALVKEIEDKKIHVIWLFSKHNDEDVVFSYNSFWDNYMLGNSQYRSVWSKIS